MPCGAEVLEPRLFRNSSPDAQTGKGVCRANQKTATTTISIKQAYQGSNAGASKSICSRLEKKGQLGRIAAELFRIQKASSRAKDYRGGVSTSGYSRSYRDLAYDRKNLILRRLCDLLYSENCGLCWGWGMDTGQRFAKHVLYLDLPQGQVSFHSTERYLGDNYAGIWDGQHVSEERVLEFCEAVTGQENRPAI